MLQDSNASGWIPFLFDVIAYPVVKGTEKKAANSSTKGEGSKPIKKDHCLRITACDPKRNYMARTYYLICKSNEQRDRIIEAVNFNTSVTFVSKFFPYTLILTKILT